MATVNELSNLQCSKAKPDAKPYRLSDRGGLFLLVAPTGGKLWRWKYRFDGKERLMAFGKYPDVSLAQARLLHAKARALLATGVDPMAERKEAKQEKREALVKQEQKATTDPIFEDLARKWLAWWRTDKSPRYAARAERRIESNVISQLGKMHPADIKRMDIVKAVKATDGHAHYIAQKNLQMIRRIFDWGVNNGFLDENSLNPASSIRAGDILSKVVKGHFARVSLAEVPEMIQKIDQYTGYPATCLAMELLSLTFLRTSELIGGRWKEIDWEQKQWIIPAERMKGRREEKKAQLVPLATQTIAAFKRLHALTGTGEYMFPGIRSNSKTVSTAIILQALKRLGYQGKMTGHGWRGIASTYLHEKGFDHLYIETQLAHCGGAGDQVAAVYNYALYLEPRRKMMQDWADFLDECRKGAVKDQRAA